MNEQSHRFSGSSVVPGDGTRPDVMLPPTGLFVDGQWGEAVEGGSFPVLNPSTEQVIADVAAAGVTDVDRAVAAARHQLEEGDWSRLRGAERGRLLWILGDLVERDSRRLAELEMLDVGQPSMGSRAAVEAFRYFAGWADKIDGRSVELSGPARPAIHAYTRREPVGVVGAITPWNTPLMIAAWKLAPALAAGCTVVLKAPEDAPLSSLHLASLAEEAGFPPGVVNILPGIGEVAGAALVRHPGVDKVSFTGSPEVGREVAKAAAETCKRVTLELGGKSPQIVFADADLTAAVPAAARGFYFHGGQVCAAGSRILVHEDLIDEVLGGLAEEASRVTVGDPFAAGTSIGPLVSSAQMDRVLGYIAKGRQEGGDLVVGGERVASPGYFVAPTVFRGTNDLTISQDEIFGPVATVISFGDIDEAIAIANDTRYGLSASVWTRDLATAHRAAARIRAGTVRVNGGVPVDPRMPWGGFHSSGLGRELSYSGIEACTEEKSVTISI